jgi:hypothetical protein
MDRRTFVKASAIAAGAGVLAGGRLVNLTESEGESHSRG